ncbi:hypothetical protein BJ322DRAFT_1023471 [Thelephora terrestris]|uniref:Uncharacterized protein n=1 Tax=Thelephora terrestris TaxID=56493 RepID=A0A9P6H9T0_9AGAM|nr:hypothetical protein BJ322DRAFT_1023471 [Thelephora terrestris]
MPLPVLFVTLTAVSQLPGHKYISETLCGWLKLVRDTFLVFAGRCFWTYRPLNLGSLASTPPNINDMPLPVDWLLNRDTSGILKGLKPLDVRDVGQRTHDLCPIIHAPDEKSPRSASRFTLSRALAITHNCAFELERTAWSRPTSATITILPCTAPFNPSELTPKPLKRRRNPKSHCGGSKSVEANDFGNGMRKQQLDFMGFTGPPSSRPKQGHVILADCMDPEEYTEEWFGPYKGHRVRKIHLLPGKPAPDPDNRFRVIWKQPRRFAVRRSKTQIGQRSGNFYRCQLPKSGKTEYVKAKGGKARTNWHLAIVRFAIGAANPQGCLFISTADHAAT